MQTLSINTPALLFPAITLLMLAYTNRFLSLASLVRKLHEQYLSGKTSKNTLLQIRNIRSRLNLIRYMQGFGVVSFLCCVLTMLLLFKELESAAYFIFALSLVFLILSMLLMLREINISTKALELELSDMEDVLGSGNIISDIFKGV
jgi:Protein of unknown function (DUF2721)